MHPLPHLCSPLSPFHPHPLNPSSFPSHSPQFLSHLCPLPTLRPPPPPHLSVFFYLSFFFPPLSSPLFSSLPSPPPSPAFLHLLLFVFPSCFCLYFFPSSSSSKRLFSQVSGGGRQREGASVAVVGGRLGVCGCGVQRTCPHGAGCVCGVGHRPARLGPQEVRSSMQVKRGNTKSLTLFFFLIFSCFKGLLV